MTYSDLIKSYFERSVALQWYWTIYVVVIGGVLAFSSFRQHKDFVTTGLVMALYACFAFKNLGAIEATLMERNALVAAIREFPTAGAGAVDTQRVRDLLEPTLITQEFAGVRNFHVACDLMTIAAIWAKELRRKKTEQPPATGAA